jgi:D-alanine-D-alanine ligase
VLKPATKGSSWAWPSSRREGNYGNPIGRDVEGPWKHFDELMAEPFIRGRN